MSSSSPICSSSSLARWEGERKRTKLPTVLVLYLVTATGNALYYKSLIFTVLQCNNPYWVQTGSVPCLLPHPPPPPPPLPPPPPRGCI